ncbi:hypothetical protein GR160_18455 [Flavobacterium sp. Sd200]|uniref:YecA family protein n=1 Tax=Flavobacterium sp. Sd200 TaxID=2692211 RepID=UPI001371E50C|nr:SEC-C domain-containing protein [Flavobacterium sp. Sd200]MXN93215.1 hypothetical protein [Flavobacterium sp. Sd200]
MKTGRNDLCPCGSGKKYKKCCIFSDNLTFSGYLSSFSSLEALKVLSLLQILPINQAKLVRLESIQDKICQNINDKEVSKYDQLIKTIHKEYDYDYREDPLESCATENLMFFNGNNIVFPGIAKDSTNINQLLLNSIFHIDDSLADETKDIIREGTVFLLYIHDRISKSIGLQRNMSEDDYRGQIYFPEQDFADRHKSLFEFTQNDIENIYAKFQIAHDVISYFSTHQSEVINNEGEETILIQKPFLKVGGKYYLAMPSAQMYCLNLFIREVAKSREEQNVLDFCYNRRLIYELHHYLGSYWSKLKVDIELNQYESIWQFDNNKLAYVCFLPVDKDNSIESRANEVMALLKAKFDYQVEFLSLFVFASYELDEIQSYGFEDIDEATYMLALNFFDIDRLFTNWDFDKLSLWKYARAENIVHDDRSVEIMPFYSTLTYYKYYMSNRESFYRTDEKMPNVLSFDFATQGNIAIEATQKNDKHFIFYINENGSPGYLPVTKTQQYAPIYTSEEILYGKLRVALEYYSLPIWLTSDSTRDSLSNSFIEAMVYWLYELREHLMPFVNKLGRYPIEITLFFSEELRQFLKTGGQETLNDNDLNIESNINISNRKIKIIIPLEIFNVLHRKDNYGERLLVDSILHSFKKFGETQGIKIFGEHDIQNLLDAFMPLSRKKMILTSHMDDSIKRYSLYIPTARFLSDADSAIILENNVKWLNYQKSVPSAITSVDDKLTLLYDLITSLRNQLRLRLKHFNSFELLKHVILRHEAIIYKSGYLDLSLTAKLECFSHYQDIVEEYKKANTDIIKSSHTTRSLIECIVAEPYFGDDVVNDNDVDFLIALLSEINFYGNVIDSIQLKLDDPEIGLLPSGRIGLNHDFYDSVIHNYRESVIMDEVQESNESFDSLFKVIKKDENIPLDPYHDKIDKIFKDELGIAFSRIIAILRFLSVRCFENKASYYYCKEDELIPMISTNSILENGEIEAFIKFMSLETRGRFDTPPLGYFASDINTWRYNREFSYVRRPLLKIKMEDGSYSFIWSARHLAMASENLMYIFFNGLLKVDEKQYPEISKLVKERNIIKGKEYRDTVLQWLKQQSIYVHEQEIKVRKSVFPNAEKDYGDIDVLVVDDNTKTVYLIECKNTKQAKIMYDFQNDAKNYIDKQLPKHVNRGNFIKYNLETLSKKIGKDVIGYNVQPIVISSYQLPVKFIQDVPIPIYSFTEVKRSKIFS